MTFRTRLLTGFAVATVVPLALLGIGVRRQIDSRLRAQHMQRVDALARVAMEDLSRERALIDNRLQSLASSIADDNHLRLALVAGASGGRALLLEWAGEAVRGTGGGLSMLQLQDEQGRILSSSHFRNEFDRLEPALPRLLAEAKDSMTLVAARTPDGRFLALARVDSVRLGGRLFTLVGGITVDSALLSRFARDADLSVSLVTPDDSIGTGSAQLEQDWSVAATRSLLYIDARAADAPRVAPARLVIRQSRTELAALERDVDRWFFAAVAAAVAGALALAAWLAAGLSRPVAELARATSTIDLEGPEVALATQRDDEIGALARRFGGMMRRLRLSAARLRDAERRATVGEMARQVNHDIKNGLIPIRNVMRHLVEVQEQRPAELSTVFAERRATLESSVSYLDTLARNYAKLTPTTERRSFDANDVVRDVVAGVATTDHITVETRLATPLPLVIGDPLVFRRIVDNVLRNALESLPESGGRVSVTTARTRAGGVRLEISDTGCGMSEAELDRAFDDFFTTKEHGTGLGLSVVRRLTADLHAALRVTSEKGRGTTFIIDLPTLNGTADGTSDARFARTVTSTNTEGDA